MFSKARHALSAATLTLFLAGACFAQTATIEGDVKDETGQPLKDAVIKIERLDIKGNYKTKTNKKGHYLHVGLPLGTYKVSVEVNGQVRDMVNGVQARLGDPTVVDFDLQRQAAQQAATQKAIETGTLTEEQKRDMSPEQRAALEKQMKEQQQQFAKKKELNDAFNQGMEAMKTKQWDMAIQAFEKAGVVDPQQHVIWAQLGDAYANQAAAKPGAEGEQALNKAIESFGKAIALKPDAPEYHNNYGLALAKAKKVPEAQEQLNKAVALDPTGAGKYYYNLGAVLVNTGQVEPAGEIFKKAIEADPNYADAHYQYGVYLISKATTTPEGKVVPPEGTKESFEKYLALKPDGPFAEGAKAMLATIGAKVDTTYTNPSAPKKGGKKK
jgi:tetratricopeptide (TPR) repeat protein